MTEVLRPSREAIRIERFLFSPPSLLFAPFVAPLRRTARVLLPDEVERAIQATLAFTMPPDRFVSLTLVPDNAALAPQPEVPKAASEAPKAIPVSA